MMRRGAKIGYLPLARVMVLGMVLGMGGLCSCGEKVAVIDRGTAGVLTWVLHSDSTLIISGLGEMPDYNLPAEQAPWHAHRKAIKAVRVEAGVSCLGQSAFRGCSSLTDIVLPESLVRIGGGVFSYCSALTRITLPSGVTDIGGYAFYNCSTLVGVTCLALVPPSLVSPNFTASADTLYVPAGSVAAYRDDLVWSRAFTAIAAVETSTTTEAAIP